MGAALGAADEVVVLDVYLARETPDPAVTGRLVADAVPLPGEQVAFVAGLDEAAAELAARARHGDLVLTLGAGSVTEVGPLVLDLLAAAVRSLRGATRPTPLSAPPSARASASRAASGVAAGWRGATCSSRCSSSRSSPAAPGSSTSPPC